MSDDEALAGRLVALGVICGPGESLGRWSPELFVSSWRIAGKLMERCDSLYWEHDDFGYQVQAWPDESQLCPISTKGDSLPRAIIEACVTALEES